MISPTISLASEERTVACIAIAEKFLADLYELEQDVVGHPEAYGEAFALNASVGQLLLSAYLKRWNSEPRAAQAAIAGVASGFMSGLFQLVGDSAAPFLLNTLGQGVAEGLDRVREVYGAKGTA